MTVSAAFVLLMSGLILFETSNIIHGGETNYVMATVTLFVSIFNLFTSLLHLLGFMKDVYKRQPLNRCTTTLSTLKPLSRELSYETGTGTHMYVPATVQFSIGKPFELLAPSG